MRYRACVLSRDPDFAQFIRLTLLTKIRPVVIAAEQDIPDADIYVVDLDTVTPPALAGKVLWCSAHLTKPSDCPYLWADRPFRPARLLALLDLTDDAPTGGIHPDVSHASILVNDSEVLLSAREFALFMALWEADGDYVSREALLARVWGDEETDDGIVNVYIHYLRRKLETNGHKYIYAARGRGYRLERRKELC